MKKFIFKTISIVLTITLIIQLLSTSTNAWEQNAHKEINKEAINKFQDNYANASKYKNAYVNFDKYVDAPFVSTSGKFERTYLQYWSYNKAKEFIIHGGFSADEPHVYVSVKHFYDPLNPNNPELTDQYMMHGWHLYEAIPANEWALKRQDNPYSLVNAMKNYKMSMEIPYDASVVPLNANADFRDYQGNPKDIDEMRSMYAGKAMRGLGEVMHLVGDMTQPAHVRNDSHPKYEVTETSVKRAELAETLTTGPRYDGLNLSDYGNKINDLMMGLATWTNSNFYSEDTIYDEKLGVSPNNWEKPYSSPQFSNYTKRLENRYFTWFKYFGTKEVPMVRMNMGVFYDSYEITPEFAVKQAEILLPLASSACAKTIDMFFPTLELTQSVAEESPDQEIFDMALEAGATDLKQFNFSATLTHKVEDDANWEDNKLKISYSGPGKINRIRGRKEIILCDVEFKDGKIVAYQDPYTGEMIDGTPNFWMPLGSEKRIKFGMDAVDYIVEMEDVLYITVFAGVQAIESEPYIFEQNAPTITLEADRTTIMPGEEVEFIATVEDPPERYRIEWTFGDEEDDEENIIPPVVSRNTTMKHTYSKEKEYYAQVKLIDTKRNIVRATDSINISSYMGEMSGPWEVIMEIEEESKFFRALIIAFMKAIVNFIIIPIIEAFGEEPGDINSELDSFTFVGTTLTYSLDLRRVEESETLYEGPFIFIESNTGYIEGSDDIYALRMEIIDGSIVMTALGYNEDGNYVEFEYLKDGKLISPGVIEGNFNLPGFMSGKWTATKK